MKFLSKLSVLVILLIGLMAVQSFGATDLFNNDVTIDETFSTVVVKYTFTFADSSDKYHSKPFFIADCNDADGYIWAVQSAVGDANVVFHFSPTDNIANETGIWSTSTPADLDALSNTAKFDTIGVEQNADIIQYHNARWMVVEVLGGSATNADGNVVTIYMMFTKDHYFINNGQPVSVSGKATHSYTNP